MILLIFCLSLTHLFYSHSFAHDKGALVGLVIGCIAFVGLIAAWASFVHRRHRMQRLQAEAAAPALGRGSRIRALTLGEEDEDEPNGPATRFVGAGLVSYGAGGAVYDRLRGGNQLESPGDSGAISPTRDTRNQDEAGGGLGEPTLPPIPIVGGYGEEASLMHPANRSAADIGSHQPSHVALGELGVVPPSPLKSPTRSVSRSVRTPHSLGVEPAEWLGGRPLRPVSADSVYSNEALSNTHSLHDLAAAAATSVALGGAALASHNDSVSSHGHDGYALSSAHGHAAGSSSGGHGSSSGHRGGSSSGGHNRANTVPSSSSHAPLLPPTPSSLLPTQIQPPPPATSSYRNVEDWGSTSNPRRMSGLIDRSLRGLHLRSARLSVPPLPVNSTSPSAPTTFLSSGSPRQSVYDPATARPSSIVRPLSPTLGSLSAVPIVRHEPTIPEDAQPQSIQGSGGAPDASARGPIWPGLGQLHANPAMPSPALTEGSSTHDGLLDPRWSLLGQHGMQSQGAISFRDDMDYSRPIGEASAVLS